MNFAFFLQQTACGAIAAAGFGVLFNTEFSLLPYYAAGGAVGLAVRACCLSLGWSLEEGSFVAALTVGMAIQLFWKRSAISQDMLGVAGCIPMIPGSFAAKAIINLFALTTSRANDPSGALITGTQYALRMIFTTGAIGTGLAIPALLLRLRVSE
jgi:uncharacterized membrane protein YjjB (DUF3815 family)